MKSTFLYLFDQATTADWGKGTPFTSQVQYIGTENVARYPKTIDSNMMKSPRLYFEKARLIGCSVHINSVNPTNVLYIGGVLYETPINRIAPPTNQATIDELTQNFVFLTIIYENAI
jgi:hypothetical protein